MALSALGALTAEQLKSVLAAGPDLVSRSSPFLDRDPWPLLVYYLNGRVTFVPRERFMMSQPEEPTDCVWIVPGSVASR